MTSETQQVNEYGGDWTERFVAQIQKRPAIYITDLPEHSDRNVISRLWNEIYETMVPTWQDMTSSEKSKKGKDLQSKWRNLKTCFRRELNKQRDVIAGQAAKKRRKYMYFDQLLFLLPTMEDRPTVSECSKYNTGTGDNSDSEDDSHATNTMNIKQDNDLNYISQPSTSTRTQQPVMSTKNSQTTKTLTYEESLLTILKEQKEEVIDEDKFFLLSLVPLFKKLSDAQKLDAKIEFLSTLKRLTQPRQ